MSKELQLTDWIGKLGGSTTVTEIQNSQSFNK